MDEKILGWMLQGPSETNQVYRSVDIKILHDLFEPKYKIIAEAIHKYYLRYKTPPSVDLLQNFFSKSPEAVELIAKVAQSGCQKTEVGFFVDSLRERYNKRLLAEISKEFSSPNDVIEANKTLRRLNSKIDRLYKSNIYSEGNFSDTTEERFKKYQYREANPAQVLGIPSGYKQLDEYTGGIKRSEMMVIAGASSSGKSMLLMNMAVNAWIGTNSPLDENKPIDHSAGHNVVYFTLEMNKEQLEDRMDACVAKIRHTQLTRGQLSDEEKRRFARSLYFQDNYEPWFYIIDVPRGASVRDIENKYESVVGEFQPDLICVDYLGIMGSDNEDGEADWLELGKLAAEMHEFCRNQDIPIITAAQRKTRNQKNEEDEAASNMEDIGRSKMIGDNANIVIQIANRKDEYLIEDMEAHLTKNRDGPKGKCLLRKLFDQSRIEDYPDNWAKEIGNENAVS